MLLHGPSLGIYFVAQLCDRDLLNLSITKIDSHATSDHFRARRDELDLGTPGWLPDPLGDLPWDSPCAPLRPNVLVVLGDVVSDLLELSLRLHGAFPRLHPSQCASTLV